MKQIYIESIPQKESPYNHPVEMKAFDHRIEINGEKSPCPHIFLNQNIGKGPPGKVGSPG